MYERVSVSMKCPCGRVLDTRKITVSDGKTQGIFTGTRTCPVCKKTVAYEYRGGECRSWYK